MIHLLLNEHVGISYWSRNLPHCWLWLSAAPGCPVACSWKTLDWQTSHWTPSSPPCYHSRPSCELQWKKRRNIGCKFKQLGLMKWKGGEQCVLTGSSEGDAEVCDWQQLRWVDAISSQQLHKITCFCTTKPGPLRKLKHCFITCLKYCIIRIQYSDIHFITVHWLGRIYQHV